MRTALLETADGGLLAGGAVPGSAGGTLAGAGLSVVRDTRDHVVSSTRGSYAAMTVRRVGAPFPGDFDFNRATLDLRLFRPLGRGQVLGVQAYGRSAVGDVPFQSLPVLGGQRIMRGVFEGRYRDHHLVAAQAEYRLHVWRRLGLVGFAAAGQVAPRLDGLALSELHYTAGYGLRFLLNAQEGMNLRLDFGYGGGGASGVYITAGEAF
jgi:outer membrane protein assembly factor BamA